MGLFGRKKTEDENPPASGKPPADGNGTGNTAGGAGGGGAGGTGGGGSEQPAFSPENTRKWFDRARTVHTTTNYEYAMSLWLNGLRLDPSSMDGLEGFFASAAAFSNTKEGAKGPSRDTLSQFSGKGDVDRYLGYLLAAGAKLSEAVNWIRAAEIAFKLGLRRPALRLAELGLKAAAGEKKPRRDHYVALMEVFRQVEQFELAVKAGEAAVRLDPSDNRLAQRVKNLSAESTMTKGGYENTGQEGGFRQNIKDSSAQQRLEQEDRISKTDETLDRLVGAAKSDYDINPADRNAVRKYYDRLVERGRPEDEKLAYEIATKAFEQTQEYMFKQRADAVRLKWARRELEKRKQAAEAPDADEVVKERYESYKKQLEQAELQELESRVANYPSDLTLQFELGRKYFDLGRWDNAIDKFQKAQSDPKQRARVLNYLGLSFQQLGWHDEAIETLRKAIEAHNNANDDTGMTLRYGLMLSLQLRAIDQNDLSNAEEAYKIASSIAIQNISYKDIRVRREELKQLLGKLKT